MIDPALDGEPASGWQANLTTFGDAAMEMVILLVLRMITPQFILIKGLTTAFATPRVVTDLPTQNVEVDGQGLQ